MKKCKTIKDISKNIYITRLWDLQTYVFHPCMYFLIHYLFLLFFYFVEEWGLKYFDDEEEKFSRNNRHTDIRVPRKKMDFNWLISTRFQDSLNVKAVDSLDSSPPYLNIPTRWRTIRRIALQLQIDVQKVRSRCATRIFIDIRCLYG